VNPATGVIVGKVNAALHVLLIAVTVGAAGKITALPASEAPHGASAFAALLPHVPVKTYLDFIV